MTAPPLDPTITPPAPAAPELLERLASSGGADPDPATPAHEKLSNKGALLFAIVLFVVAVIALYAAVQVWRSRKGGA